MAGYSPASRISRNDYRNKIEAGTVRNVSTAAKRMFIQVGERAEAVVGEGLEGTLNAG